MVLLSELSYSCWWSFDCYHYPYNEDVVKNLSRFAWRSFKEPPATAAQRYHLSFQKEKRHKQAKFIYLVAIKSCRSISPFCMLSILVLKATELFRNSWTSLSSASAWLFTNITSNSFFSHFSSSRIQNHPKYSMKMWNFYFFNPICSWSEAMSISISVNIGINIRSSISRYQ